MLTRSQKDEIRAYWPWNQLRFKKTGEVVARTGKSNWRVLYGPGQAEAHLKVIREIRHLWP